MRWNTDDGAGIAEYVLLVALIALVALAGILLLGGGLGDLYTDVNTNISQYNPGP